MILAMDKSKLENMTLKENYYIAVCRSSRGVDSAEIVKKLLAFARVMDLTQERFKLFDTHVVLKDYGNYIGTYNLDTGVRDTILKSTLLADRKSIVYLGVVHGGINIMKILEEAKNKPTGDTPTIIRLIHEEIDKDKYFIALEYYSPHTGHLVVPELETSPRDVRRVCGIVDKKELEYYQTKYPEVTISRTGI